MLWVMRPMLPTADRLLPYLRRLDAARIYSNFGPLTIEFQTRLAGRFKMSADSIVSASCGTTALMGAILAAAGPATKSRPHALVPAFTFAASAAAVERCGYTAYLADVDAESWMLDPGALLRHSMLDQIGVVVPVAPFGRPVPQAPWREFQTKTGIPVVIDAAASFDCVSRSPAEFLGDIPAVLSFHATKSFATGEGGCVISSDVSLIERAAQALNFGFHGTRDSAAASLNGKMSEYHAAVGLAEFDGWTAKQAAMNEVVRLYREELSNKALLSRFIASPDISGCYALFFCRSSNEAAKVQNELRRSEIDSRLWYGAGLHHQSHFSDRPQDDLKVTENISQRLVGLPTAPDLTQADIQRVAAAIHAAVK
jgi:dTDP-4-amino-4,6-dideoxygalactose transaminase